jgi:SNF2 family DNA or RNA helicase
MGLPKVLPVALKRLEAAVQGKHLTGSGAQAIGRVIRAVSDPEMQVSFLEDRIAGATLPKVTSDVEAYITAKGPQWLEDVPYQIIVADESHCIKDMRSQQTKAVLALSKKAARRHIMSGTPTLGNPLHLYPQMKFLSPAIIPEDWLRFSDKFLVRAKYNKRIVLGFQNMNILNQRVQRVAINKTKEECLDLPPRSIIDVPVEMSAEQKKLYNTLVSSMAVDLEAFFGDPLKRQMEVANAATLLNKLAQVSSGFMISGGETQVCNGCPHVTACVPLGVLPGSPGCKVPQPEPTQREVKFTKENPKLEALDELLDTILANPTNKVIVWGVYHAELDAIEQMLAKKLGDKKHWVRVDGRTGTKIQDYINQFNNDPDCRVYVGQIATGVGITLNAASYMIYYALDWSLATYLQSIDRNYRAGQDKKTFVYRLLCRGTVDDYKATALDEKKDISAVLTSKLTCITCQKRTECLLAGIELFDKGCIYQRSTRRTVARPETLQ